MRRITKEELLNIYPGLCVPELFTCDYIMYDDDNGLFTFEKKPIIESLDELKDYNLQECTAEEMLAAIDTFSAERAIPEIDNNKLMPYEFLRLPIQNSNEINYTFKCDFEKGAFYIARDNKVLFAIDPYDSVYFESDKLVKYVIRKEVHFNAPNPADLYDENGHLKPGWQKYLQLK